MSDRIILAFESSCDDTSVALVNTNYEIIAQLTSSQVEHNKFGGVLPELASRLHMKSILILTNIIFAQTKLCQKDISAIAVSINPGLIGSLLVGLSFAKSLAWSYNIPLITVNHMIGHLFANYIVHKYITPPYLSLIVSGGHTELVHVLSEVEYVSVGKTYDDAAGETFDKIAKLLDLGYPGGPAIDKLAINGDSEFYRFPRALADKGNYDFSFSGLKTSVKQFLCTQSSEFINSNKINLAASIQEAIIDPLVNKTIRYAKKNGIKQILLCGGVAANSRLRSKMMEIADRLEIEILYPPINLCIDNAAMIAAAAIAKLQNEQYSDLTINAFSKKGIRHI